MKSARAFLVLALLLTSGCLAQTYPGVVVGNPDTEDPPAPSKPGEIESGDHPDPSQGPALADPETPVGDPAAPGPIQKDPEEETQADADGTEVPGGDRVGETPDQTPPPAASRPPHADFGGSEEIFMQ